MTGYGGIATAVEAVKRGAIQYLTKPAATPSTAAGPQTMTLDRVEWEHINRVLVECDGNVSEAARTLGLHRRTLQRKLAKFPSSR